MERAQIHLVTAEQRSARLSQLSEEGEIAYEEVTSELTAIVKAHFPAARHGDVVKIDELCGYRNDATFIIGSEGKVLPLDTDDDEYGNVPSTLPILGPEGFGPKHWSAAVEHNKIIWFDAAPHADEILRNTDFDHLTELLTSPEDEDGEGYVLKIFSHFTRNGQTFRVGFEYSPAADAEDQTPEAIRGLVTFAARGLLPWNYDEREDQEAEKTLLIGVELVARFHKEPGTGWRWLESGSMEGDLETNVWCQRTASGDVVKTTETRFRRMGTDEAES